MSNKIASEILCARSALHSASGLSPLGEFHRAARRLLKPFRYLSRGVIPTLLSGLTWFAVVDAANALPNSYTFKYFQLPKQATGIVALNDSDEIIGPTKSCDNSDNTAPPSFVYELKTKKISIIPPNDTHPDWVCATTITNRGNVGFSTPDAFQSSDSTFIYNLKNRDIATLSYFTPTPCIFNMLKMNNANLYGGYYIPGNCGGQIAFIYNAYSGNYVSLDGPNHDVPVTYFFGMNDNGIASVGAPVGYLYDYWTRQYTSVPYAGPINNGLQILSKNSNLVYDTRSGQSIKLTDPLGGALTPVDINNKGEVAGLYLLTGSSDNAFIATPSSLLSPNDKDIAAANATGFQQISDTFDNATMAMEGPSAIQEKVEDRAFVAVIQKAVGDNDEIFAKKVELSLGCLRLVERFAKAIVKKSGWPAVVTDISHLAFSYESLTNALRAGDPPDFNYKVVAQPSQLSLPPTENAEADAIIADHLSVVSLNAAVLHATERWQGALLAGDKRYVKLQADAFVEYSQELQSAVMRVNEDDETLRDLLPTVDVDEYPGGAKAIAKAINKQCGRRLRRELNDQLLALGLAQPYIDDAVCEAVSPVRAKDISTDFKNALEFQFQ
jgi:hypothetical protein